MIAIFFIKSWKNHCCIQVNQKQSTREIRMPKDDMIIYSHRGIAPSNSFVSLQYLFNNFNCQYFRLSFVINFTCKIVNVFFWPTKVTAICSNIFSISEIKNNQTAVQFSEKYIYYFIIIKSTKNKIGLIILPQWRGTTIQGWSIPEQTMIHSWRVQVAIGVWLDMEVDFLILPIAAQVSSPIFCTHHSPCFTY